MCCVFLLMSEENEMEILGLYPTWHEPVLGSDWVLGSIDKWVGGTSAQTMAGVVAGLQEQDMANLAAWPSSPASSTKTKSAN